MLATKTVCSAFLVTAFLFLPKPGESQQTVRVGIFPEAGPFTLFDEATQETTGAAAEIVELLSEDAGFAIEWVPITGAGSNPMVAAIDADQIDLISYPFQMTDARKEQYDFSDPIYNYGETLVVQSDDAREYRSPADLRDRSVGVVEGSNYVDIANQVGANARVTDSLDSALNEVDGGLLDAAMGTAPVLIYRVQQGLLPNARVPSEYRSDSPLPAGLGVKKGNTALLETVNAGLAELMTDGTIQEISTRWGVEDLVAQ